MTQSSDYQYSNDYQYGNKTIYSIKSEAARYTWAGYLLLVLISSLVGDTTILITSIKYRAFKLHKAIAVIIQHIAFCDLMVTVWSVLPHFISISRNEWAFGNFLCHQSPYTRYFFNLTSVVLISNMTTCKVLLLKYPLRFETVSVKNVHMLCAACWAAVLIVPITLFLVVASGGQDISDFSYLSYMCVYHYKSGIWHWLKPTLAVLYILIPNCAVVATTIYLLTIAKQVARRGRESLKWQGIMTTVSIATVYCISSLPTLIFQVGEFIVKVDDHSSSFFHATFARIAVSLLYLNTISNFYIYSLSLHSFRDFIRSRIQQAKRIFFNSRSSASHGKATVKFLYIFSDDHFFNPTIRFYVHFMHNDVSVK